ncbi:MAG: DUF1549 domain-containing protein [Phycisphaerae bacterium]|nr:DUF1549 domain-containing protein [Phycisphaerae bacterium]
MTSPRVAIGLGASGLCGAVALLAALAPVPRHLTSDDPPPTPSAPRVDQAAASDRAADDAIFAAEVLPVLEARCVECHGREKAKAGLRLHALAEILGAPALDRVVVGGDLEASELWRRINLHAEDEEAMPPKGDRLAAAEIDAVRRWIEAMPAEDLDGAAEAVDEATLHQARVEEALRDRWAFRPLVKPEPPRVMRPEWCRNEVDFFVLGTLEAAGLEPAPEADPLTLLRRASLDLVGLPPSPEEIDAFLAAWAGDPEEAWSALLDRLLASPHHGEKWGRHWLDLVRYADTNGFERDGVKNGAWKYRDWVVAALNADMPYDRFVLEQLAGDELPDRGFGSLVATGIYRLGMWDDEVPDLKQALADDLDGIVDVVGRTFLALPMGCVRCHDHKGDPIAHEEYYEFAAYFAGVRPYKTSPFNSIAAENVLRMVRSDFGHADPEAERRAHRAERERLIAAVRAIEASAGLVPDADAFVDRAPTNGLVAHFAFEDDRSGVAVDSRGGASATVRDAQFARAGRVGRCFGFDGGDDRVEVARPVSASFTISLWMRTTDVGGGSESDRRWFLGKGLVDGEIPGIVPDFGVSLISNGHVAAGTGDPETFLSSGPGHNDGAWHHVAFTRDMSSGEVALFVDGVEVDRAPGSTAPLDRPTMLAIGAMLPGHGAFAGDLDEVRFFDRVLAAEEIRASATGLLPPAEARELVAAALGAEEASRLESLHAELAALRSPDFRGESVLVVRDVPEPPATFVMERGSPHSLGARVEPDVPAMAGAFRPGAIVAPAHGESSGRRLALARWIADARNGLALRAIANRLWQHHLAAPIVPTPSDFGRFGEKPTHPELLDWLAATFAERGFSMKDFHRLVMQSATYRMSSVPSESALLRDPANELLSRQRMRRLTAEELRDGMLAANGTIDLRLGGEGIRPPMPAEVLATSSTPDSVWPLTPEETWSRRSLYILQKRSLQHPLLVVFDSADIDSPCPVRFSTVQPTQALSMLNGELVIREARLLARRLERERPGDLRGQAALGRLLVGGRPAAGEDLDEAVAFVEELEAIEGLSRGEALENLCLVLFNLNEFLYVD